MKHAPTNANTYSIDLKFVHLIELSRQGRIIPFLQSQVDYRLSWDNSRTYLTSLLEELGQKENPNIEEKNILELLVIVCSTDAIMQRTTL